jgi:hypothetical protein
LQGKGCAYAFLLYSVPFHFIISLPFSVSFFFFRPLNALFSLFFILLASWLLGERFKPPGYFPLLRLVEQFQDNIFLQEVMAPPVLGSTVSFHVSGKVMKVS